MTALHPHPLHKESLLILLGLAPLPANVRKLFEKKTQMPEECRRRDTYDPAEKERFSNAVLEIIATGIHDESTIIGNIEADEECAGKKIIPRGIKYGKAPARGTIATWICKIKLDHDLQRQNLSDQIVPLALKGKTISQSMQIVGCKIDTARRVYGALGLLNDRKAPPKLEHKFAKRIRELAHKLKHEELNNGIR
jgi:hypothetical protein